MNNHQRYMRWLRDKAAGHPQTIVTRTYKNASGADELIAMSKGYWTYVDWLEARGDISFAEWVIHCERNPHGDMPISELLMFWLWTDECNRWMMCAPTPSEHLPGGFNFWKATYGDKVWTAGCRRLSSRSEP